jgi:RNA polymerase sigma factor for flagellar operon FliA
MTSDTRRPDGADGAHRDERLVEHLKLVYHVARQMKRTISANVEYDELVSLGTLGLMNAIDSFDAARGVAFSTFAVPCIRGAILEGLRDQDHVPRSIRRRARQMAGAREALSLALGRPPEEPELAEHLGIPIEMLWRWKRDCDIVTELSLDDTPSDEDGAGGTMEERVAAGDGSEVEDTITREQEAAILVGALKELKDQERIVLALYYHEELKMREIAEVLDLTESRVSQIRSRALTKLRKRLAVLRPGEAIA